MQKCKQFLKPLYNLFFPLKIESCFMHKIKVGTNYEYYKKKLSNNFQAFVDVHAHEKLFKRKIVFYITSQFYNLPTKKYL